MLCRRREQKLIAYYRAPTSPRIRRYSTCPLTLSILHTPLHFARERKVFRLRSKVVPVPTVAGCGLLSPFRQRQRTHLHSALCNDLLWSWTPVGPGGDLWTVETGEEDDGRRFCASADDARRRPCALKFEQAPSSALLRLSSTPVILQSAFIGHPHSTSRRKQKPAGCRDKQWGVGKQGKAC